MLHDFGKCKCLHTGPGNTGMNYEMGGTILGKTVKENDLGVTMNANMKLSEQCRIAAAKARHTYSRLCLFTTRLNCREPIGSRPCSVHCPDYTTHIVTTRSRSSDSLNAATWCLLSMMNMHHGAIWSLDTHQ